MKSTLRIISPAEPGKSFSSERKRVRVHLLKHYQPFVDELHDLVATLESYSNGVDEELLESTKTRWQVLIDIVPESVLQNAKESTGIAEFDRSILLNKNERSLDGKSPEEDLPIVLIWDNRYLEPMFCTGTPIFDLGQTPYVIIPATLSLNEGTAALKKLGLKEEKGYLSNTDEEDLKEAGGVLICMAGRKMTLAATVRELNGNLNEETSKSKSSRYSKLFKQMIEIIQPPSDIQQN